MKAKSIMIQGVASAVGKSLITAGLCRVFKQDGYRVAPFKSQNMALNSFITQDGLEMGRAQAVQAEAAGLLPDVRMNPVLLKPTTDRNSQVIIAGKVYGNMSAVEYHAFKPQLTGMVKEVYQALTAENEIIVIEGAGSPAEINLRDKDIVNMGMAELADAPVLLVGDIDKGGVFAALAGTMLLLAENERRRVRGTIINKFRGDAAILQPGITMLEELMKIPVLGIIPYLRLTIDDEDSLTERFTRGQNLPATVEIAVIKLPRIANFTDFNAFENIPDVNIRYIEYVSQLGEADLIIVSGTKNTIEDLEYLRSTGLENAIIRRHRQGAEIFGICGGYQMLGKEIADPYRVESKREKTAGMGLLNVSTVMEREKTTTQVTGEICGDAGLLAGLKQSRLAGYEIHMGVTTCLDGIVPFIKLNCNPGAKNDLNSGGVCNVQGNVFGTYMHGLFDNLQFTMGIINNIRRRKGFDPLQEEPADYQVFKESQYDILAEHLRRNLDLKRIYQIMETWGS
jgi:adenosylcobyric acid synthase